MSRLKVFLFEKCHIKRFMLKAGTDFSLLTVSSSLTPKLANALGFKSMVFTADDDPKEEFLKVQMDTFVAISRFCLTVSGIPQDLEVDTCDMAVNFAVLRAKKGLGLEFDIRFSGSALAVVAWLERNGGAKGTLALTSSVLLQAEMFDLASKVTAKTAAAGERHQ